ncbi:MAG: hypothetical protein Q4P84_01190 [Elusimicrobiales bacterium]|nr:hypothetical protein [Elusimicrobiales bacterium]
MAQNEEVIEINFYNKRGWGERLPQMTRAEAVERMAKAIYFKACGTMKDYAKCKKEYIPFAEAALDALLGGKNG